MSNRPFKTQPFFIDNTATASDEVVYGFFKNRINAIQESFPNELLLGMIYDGRYNAIYAVYSDATLSFYKTIEDKLHIFNYGTRKTNTDNTDTENVGIENNVISDDLEKVLQIIKENQPINAPKITEFFDEFSQRQIERFIRELKSLGMIKHNGTRRYGGYILIDEV